MAERLTIEHLKAAISIAVDSLLHTRRVGHFTVIESDSITENTIAFVNGSGCGAIVTNIATDEREDGREGGGE